MTKSEVRAVSLSKLELKRDSVLWDIGAGTGSIAIEALLTGSAAMAYAFEKNPEAVELIRRNREKAGLDNLVIVEGDALGQMTAMTATAADGIGIWTADQVVTHAFIGGTSGSMEAVIDLLLSLNGRIRVVINVIALETLAAVTELLKEKKIEAEIVQVQVSRACKAGGYHLMQGQNPVYIISFGGGD